MKNLLASLLVCSLLVSCASIIPTAKLLHRGIPKTAMLELMGAPENIVTTYHSDAGGVYEKKQFMFASSKCSRGERSICSVIVSEEGKVQTWIDVSPQFTEDGQ